MLPHRTKWGPKKARNIIRTKNLTGKEKLEREVVENSRARQALVERNIIPETLIPEEDIKKIEKRREKEHKALEDSIQKSLN